MKTGPSYIAYPPFYFKFFPASPSLSPPTPNHTALSVVLFLWLNGWLCHIWWAILLNDKPLHVEPWYLGARKTFMCVLCNNASSLLRSDTWCVFLLALWFDITHTNTHTQTHTAHSGASRLIHHINIYLHHMCSQQLFLLHWMNNSLISKMYFPKFLFFSKIIHL